MAIRSSFWLNLANEQKTLRGRGGMVDAADLKSVDCKSREGSSPSAPIKFSHQLNLMKYDF
jgi:hypothetical protein